MNEKGCFDTLVDLADMNRNMVASERVRRVQLEQIRQTVGYLIDAAEPSGNQEYIVPAELVEDLREIVFSKRGDIDD